MEKNDELRIRIKVDDKAKVLELAKKKRLSVSALVRTIVLKAYDKTFNIAE